MKISVLIAAYHAAPFMPGALASVARQSHSDWELVVVEDGSNDGTEALVRDFVQAYPKNNVVYENLGENRGVAAARNRLLALATGDAVAFLDADDHWQPDHLAHLAAAFEAGASLAFSGIEIWDGDNNVSRGHYVPPGEWVAQPRRWLFEHSFIQTSSCVGLTRATVQRTGLIDESLRIGEDRDYWFRAMADGGKLACTGAVTCRYTKHEGSSMTKTLRVAADTVRFYEKHAAAPDIPPSLRKRLLAEARLTEGRLVRATEPQRARQLFRSAWRTWPWSLRHWIFLLR